DGSHQAGGDVSVFAGVRGIDPHGRTGIVLRAGQSRDVPLVRERRAGRHRVFRSLVSNVAGRIGNISGATRVPEAEDVGRPNAIAARGVVLENDLDRVADLGAQDWSEQTQIIVLWRARLPCGKRAIGVLTIDRFAIDVPDVSGARLGVRERRAF